ncbi:molybdopterin converting factor subunit 1 [Methylobacillus caricis]|uniref:molybdopterin converting factor subunit 1 n=1 Tax=Methylobacillus caricis TaxID=1971611 RepID=UPI001CFFAB20|nr:molybdopterin converting factor subunit 1 [Methylobacillus caricis]MCB5187710.1 molybdopterin converting factor subunit 1 [Methylobacillus caricis]
MIQLLYFARLREALNMDGEALPLTEAISVSALMASLAARGGAWQEQFDGTRPLRAAINQELVANTALIQPGDEVAFFPPVTGG